MPLYIYLLVLDRAELTQLHLKKNYILKANNRLTGKVATKWKKPFLNLHALLQYCPEILERDGVMQSHCTEGM